MLNKEEIKEIVRGGEGHTAEFKVNAPANLKGIAEEVCSFANATGGFVLIGINDKDIITGVTLDNAKRSSIQNIIGEISPKLPCEFYIVDVDGKNVGVIEVPSGSNKPYTLSGSIYLRKGPNSQKLTSAEEIRAFYQQSDSIYFDETACVGATAEDDIPLSHIDDFKGRADLSEPVTKEQILQNLKLITSDGDLKNAAVLFFSPRVAHFFEEAVIHCIHFDGTDKRYIADNKIMDGTLLQQYGRSMSWLKSKLDVRFDIEGAGAGPRNELWEIPETVFKEAIINSLAHRDYYQKGARITIEVFDDRVEIANPGGLVDRIPRNEFGKRSATRNPLLFKLFEKTRMVEHVGSGITRMRKLMTEEDLPLPEFLMDGMFTVILRRPSFKFANWIINWEAVLSEKYIAIIEAVHANPKVKKATLEEVSGLSASGVDKHLAVLKEIGLVEREGTKGGSWVLHYINPTGNE